MKKEVLLLILIAGLRFSLLAQDNSDCIMCHGDKSATGKKNGKTISVYVDEKKLGNSVHAKAQCISCHVDLKDSDFPHKEVLAPAECGSCHKDTKSMFDQGVHGKALARKDPIAPRCQYCHGSHEIVKVKDKNSPVYPLQIPYLCGRCHKEGAPVMMQGKIPQSHILENYTESIHGDGLLKKGLIVSATCASCHSSHLILPHTDPRSSIARKNIMATCTVCHTSIESVHRKIIRGELWEVEAHKLPACVDCHQPHKIRKVFYDQGAADLDCMRCHGRELLISAAGKSMYVKIDEVAGSIHKKVACSQCHSEVNTSHVRPCETITKKVDCSNCHAEVGEDYKISSHGQLAAKNNPDAPLCATCHGTHGILGKANPVSPTFPTNIPNLCGKCHDDGKIAATRHKSTQHNIINNFKNSVHGIALTQSGLTVSATCSSCHTAHRQLPIENPLSSVNYRNIAATCGNCHKGISSQFISSVHDPNNTTTKEMLPNCATCHSAHQMQRTTDAGFMLTSIRVCGKCHEKSMKSFYDTYHGKAALFGNTTAAKCFDCHGSHAVFKTEDIRSKTNKANVLTMCRTCHPGAKDNFASGKVHVTITKSDDPLIYWLSMAYFWLIVLTIGGMSLHNILDFYRKLRIKKLKKQGIIKHEPHGHSLYTRMTRSERVQHFLLLTSFLTLVITGFMLRFPESFWVKYLHNFNLDALILRSYLHRIAAIVMISASLLHIYHVSFTERGRQLIKDLWPTMKDLHEAIGMLKFNVGLSKEKPKLGRFSYIEKAEYWALIWGTVIMSFTGLAMWFENTFISSTSLLGYNIVRTIHYYEAWLAFLAIVVWHFYFIMLNPDIFPMNKAWYRGYMTEEEMAEEHPAELERLKKEEAKKKESKE
jgi:cytochrome b subunit of formate dehydrogenase